MLSAHVTYCDHEQAFTVSAYAGTEEAPSVVTTWRFGPFDQAEDVVAHLERLVQAVALLPCVRLAGVNLDDIDIRLLARAKTADHWAQS